jgi:hypothetical protein
VRVLDDHPNAIKHISLRKEHIITFPSESCRKCIEFSNLYYKVEIAPVGKACRDRLEDGATNDQRSPYRFLRPNTLKRCKSDHRLRFGADLPVIKNHGLTA